jgi:hypothetical protein
MHTRTQSTTCSGLSTNQEIKARNLLLQVPTTAVSKCFPANGQDIIPGKQQLNLVNCTIVRYFDNAITIVSQDMESSKVVCTAALNYAEFLNIQIEKKVLEY